MRHTESVAIGASTLGARTEPGTPADDEAIALALEMLAGPFAGIDTANAYAEGRSEAVLGQALRRRDRSAARPAIITKVDAAPGDPRLDRDRVLESFEESLSRLGVDHIGLVHLHDPRGITVAEAAGAGGAIAGLRELKDQGLVDAIGIATGNIPLELAYIRTGEFDAVLTHNRFTLVDTTARGLLVEAKDRGMTVFNAAPFGSGILAGGGGAGLTPRYAYQPASKAVVARVEQLNELCSRHRVPLAAVALQFSTRSPLVDTTVVGVSSTRRLRELETLTATAISDELWAELDGLGRTPDPLAHELHEEAR